MAVTVKSDSGSMAEAGGDFISQFIGGLLDSKANARAMRAERDAMVLNASSKSKAMGTSTNLQVSQASEENVNVGRQALRLKGAAQASAASSNIGGNSIQAIAKDIETNAKYSMAVTRRNAENAINVNRMRNKQQYDADKATIAKMKPSSAWDIFKGAAISSALGATKRAVETMKFTGGGG